MSTIKAAPRVVAIVQARMGSPRFPGKMLQRLAGRPLLWHVVTRLRLCQNLNTVVLATTTEIGDDALAAFGEVLCVPVFRGSETNVLARLAEVADTTKADIVVRVNGDAPLIDPPLIDRLVETMIVKDADYVMPPADVPCFHDGVDPLSRRALDKLCAEVPDDPLAREHVTGYFKVHPSFVRIAVLNVPEALRVKGPRLSIDTPDDLVFFKDLYARFRAAPGALDLRQVATLYASKAAVAR